MERFWISDFGFRRHVSLKIKELLQIKTATIFGGDIVWGAKVGRIALNNRYFDKFMAVLPALFFGNFKKTAYICSGNLFCVLDASCFLKIFLNSKLSQLFRKQNRHWKRIIWKWPNEQKPKALSARPTKATFGLPFNPLFSLCFNIQKTILISFGVYARAGWLVDPMVALRP